VVLEEFLRSGAWREVPLPVAGSVT
jgi:hypothetical protein